ncbi:hypothetical protein QQF64_010553 [Cirrhinus molitorella]|uniref:Uncharacterized protein n=1 Tax=Cirrhinus molitorella TaxID=172907 RepID=A0ABR3M042_9TELE
MYAGQHGAGCVLSSTLIAYSHVSTTNHVINQCIKYPEVSACCDALLVFVTKPVERLEVLPANVLGTRCAGQLHGLVCPVPLVTDNFSTHIGFDYWTTWCPLLCSSNCFSLLTKNWEGFNSFFEYLEACGAELILFHIVGNLKLDVCSVLFSGISFGL